MIQMRWIIVPAGGGRGLLGGIDGQSYEAVLQFRESRKYTVGDAVHMNFDGVEWQDVTPPGKVWPSGG